MRVVLVPDPAKLPYRVSVEVVGRFSITGGTPEQLETFTQVNAPVILFPFIRAVVHEATANASRGPLRLNPMNLQELIKPGGWSSAPIQKD